MKSAIQFYYKEDCGLCEDMRGALTEFLATFQKQQNLPPEAFIVEYRDIEDSAEWSARFREYVPTIVVNNEEVCHYFFDAAELEEALKCRSCS